MERKTYIKPLCVVMETDFVMLAGSGGYDIDVDGKTEITDPKEENPDEIDSKYDHGHDFDIWEDW